jgi:hypothetical protein
MTSFDLDFKEEANISQHIKKFLLLPDFWSESTNQLPTKLSWNCKEFNKTNLPKIPASKGIYAFVLVPKYNNFIETKYLFYTGKTNRTLRKRYKDYLNEKEGKGKPRKKVFKMLNQYNGHLYFYYSEITNSLDVDKCEECLINTFVPHVNTQIPKAKIKHELKYIYEG